MTTYTAPQALSEEYRQTGQRSIRQADEEFEKGDFLQASEKAWTAASEYIKSLAAQRGLSSSVSQRIALVFTSNSWKT